MRQVLPAALLLCCFLCPSTPLIAADDPQTLVTRAVKELGGEAKLSLCKAVQVKVKGTTYEGGTASPFTGQVLMQLPTQFKLTNEVDMAGSTLSFVQILNKDQAWSRMEEGQEPVSDAELTALKHSAYKDYVAELWPLVTDKSFTVALGGETKIQSRFYPGIVVKRQGQPDIKLYFSVTTGLPVKTEYRSIDPESKKEVLWEEELKDYREVSPTEVDEATLKAAKVGTDDAALLDYLRKGTVSLEALSKIKALIGGLRAASFQIREKAKKELVTQGPAAAGLLAQVVNDSDPEVAGIAKECLQKIGKAADATTGQAVIRLLARRQPAGAAQVLLNYLPGAPDEAAAQYAQAALIELAAKGGKLREELQPALKDKDPAKRNAAAIALGEAKPKPGQRLFLPGVKRAMKGVQSRDGKKTTEWEISDIVLFNSLPDSAFAKP
jgi:hypothetical protein